jgi:hypothetical protein
MADDRQLDLFSETSTDSQMMAPDVRSRAPANMLSDAALVEALPYANLMDCHALATEAGRRRLLAAVPALEVLCRRFKGFGQQEPVPEQMAALQGLVTIGGPEARAAVNRLIADKVVVGPGQRQALNVAVQLSCRLPPDLVIDWLRNPDAEIRANAARCAPLHPSVRSSLCDLLSDPIAIVGRAAAISLGKMGRQEARPDLHRLAQTDPTPEVIDAITAIADDASIVILRRVALARPDLTDVVLAALEDIDNPRAAVVSAAIRRTTIQD